MKQLIQRMWTEDDGVLSFEWVLLVSLLSVGVVSGLAGARDAIIDELGDVAQAMVALDQSYVVDFPLAVDVHSPTLSGASDSMFLDTSAFSDCARNIERVDRDLDRSEDMRHLRGLQIRELPLVQRHDDNDESGF